MNLIDAHAHLHDAKYNNDRDVVIARFFDAGGQAIVNIGTSVRESRDAVNVALDHDRIYATVGLHPHVFNGGKKRDCEYVDNLGVEHRENVRTDALKNSVGELTEMIEASPSKIKAIGEIGLDYFMPGDEKVNMYQKKWQRTGFIVQIALARKHGLPVVVHCRPEDVAASDAYFDCVEIIADFPDVKFVMHCYMGNIAVTEKFLALPNITFSFTGNVTFSKKDDDQMSSVVKMISLNRMMIETDAPYLTPAPHRGKRNEPQYVQYVADRIAHLHNTSAEDVCKQAIITTKRFFQIDA